MIGNLEVLQIPNFAMLMNERQGETGMSLRRVLLICIGPVVLSGCCAGFFDTPGTHYQCSMNETTIRKQTDTQAFGTPSTEVDESFVEIFTFVRDGYHVETAGTPQDHLAQVGVNRFTSGDDVIWQNEITGWPSTGLNFKFDLNLKTMKINGVGDEVHFGSNMSERNEISVAISGKCKQVAHDDPNSDDNS